MAPVAGAYVWADQVLRRGRQTAEPHPERVDGLRLSAHA
jgi:hypothetical protein